MAMRDFEFRHRQESKKKRWARQIVARYLDVDSPKGSREVGLVARSHTFCGCFYCRRPKLEEIPTLQEVRSRDSDDDELRAG